MPCVIFVWLNWSPRGLKGLIPHVVPTFQPCSNGSGKCEQEQQLVFWKLSVVRSTREYTGTPDSYYRRLVGQLARLSFHQGRRKDGRKVTFKGPSSSRLPVVKARAARERVQTLLYVCTSERTHGTCILSCQRVRRCTTRAGSRRAARPSIPPPFLLPSFLSFYIFFSFPLSPNVGCPRPVHSLIVLVMIIVVSSTPIDTNTEREPNAQDSGTACI